MKKIICTLILSLIVLIPCNTKALTLHLFYRDGCPHCAKEKEYLDTIKNEYPNLEIKTYEVWGSTNNATIMDNVAKTLNEKINGVPYTIIGTYSSLGFNEYSKNQIKEYIDVCYKYGCTEVVKEVIDKNTSLESQYEDIIEKEYKNIEILGDINIKNTNTPLILIATVMGLVDGFNPCAMWVLIFLISMMIGMKNRKRMWALGMTFLTTSAFIYFLFMVAWLKITLEISQIKIVNLIIALIALIGGAINVRSYLKSIKTDVGCEIVDDNKRKNIIHKVKKLTTEKSFILALIGVIGLAISVNFVELLCSAGLPVVFTRILSVNDLSTFKYFMYIIIYIVFYLLDDIIIFSIAMFTLKITGITNKYNKYSHLIGGIIMLIIGILLLFKPELLMFGN